MTTAPEVVVQGPHHLGGVVRGEVVRHVEGVVGGPVVGGPVVAGPAPVVAGPGPVVADRLAALAGAERIVAGSALSRFSPARSPIRESPLRLSPSRALYGGHYDAYRSRFGRLYN